MDFTHRLQPEQMELLYKLSELIKFAEKHGFPIAELLSTEKEYYEKEFELEDEELLSSIKI